VQEIYRRAVEAVVRDFPAVDTWLTKTNDCASGFCWAEKLYNRPNGPSACAGGAPSGMAAYAKALLEGSRAAGVEAFNLFESGIFPAERILARAMMPAGAAISPDDGGSPRVMGMGSVSYRTAPVRYLADPVRVVDAALKAAAVDGPAVITANLGQHYYTDCADLDTVRMEFGLFAEARRKRPEGRIEKLEFIRDFIAKRCGAEGKELFEGYMLLHDAFGALSVVDRGLAEMNIYGALSTRWLTRPFVPFQEELRSDEESYWMRHIFNPAGVEARRNFLDLHGGLLTGAIDRGHEWDLRRSFFAKVIAGFEKAASQFEKSASARAKAIAKAARLYAGVWRNCRNAIEFGLLRSRAAEKPMIVPPDGTQGDEDRARMYDVMRDEIDNVTAFLGTLGDADPERTLTVATDARDEDTFTLGADIREQLRRKVRIMLERWKDVDRLYVAPHL
jgi:hypothetical protein